MRFLTRLRDAIFNKQDEPVKNINKYLRSVEKELGEAKAELSAVMDEELRCKRELDECNEEIKKLQDYADRAVEKGQENNLQQYSERKEVLLKKAVILQSAYETASANTARVREIHDRVVNDLEGINARKAEIKAKLGK